MKPEQDVSEQPTNGCNASIKVFLHAGKRGIIRGLDKDSVYALWN